MVRRVLDAENLTATNLNAVSVSIGPGSYTGLRVGLSTAKALCFATGCRLITVDTLQSLAMAAISHGWPDGATYLAVLDARRQDAYVGLFGSNGDRLTEDRFITVTEYSLQDFLVAGQTCVICGEGLAKWEVLRMPGEVELFAVECHATHLVSLALKAYSEGRFADVASSVPHYLKAPNITSGA